MYRLTYLIYRVPLDAFIKYLCICILTRNKSLHFLSLLDNVTGFITVMAKLGFYFLVWLTTNTCSRSGLLNYFSFVPQKDILETHVPPTEATFQ